MKPKIQKALQKCIAEWCKRRADVDYFWKRCVLCVACHHTCSICPLCSCLRIYLNASEARTRYKGNRDSKAAKAEYKRAVTNMIRYMRRRLPTAKKAKKAKKRGK